MFCARESREGRGLVFSPAIATTLSHCVKALETDRVLAMEEAREGIRYHLRSSKSWLLSAPLHYRYLRRTSLASNSNCSAVGLSSVHSGGISKADVETSAESSSLKRSS